MPAPHFPGPPGFHIPGSEFHHHPGHPIGNPEEIAEHLKEHELRHKPQEVKHLNQYTGYFTTPDGDFPVSVVANSIKEAAKILTMPGVFGENITEPTTIKYVKGAIAVSIPVRMTGFNVVIDPAGAKESGAYATPVHAEVRNGTEVLFTAYEPFGWRFVGWYKGDQLLSTEKFSAIEVYDPYSSLIEYTAKYEFDNTIRNGRYLVLGHQWYWDFKFDAFGVYLGKMTFYSSTSPDYHFVITKYEPETGLCVLNPNPSVTQGPEGHPGYGMTLTIIPTPIGFNVEVTNPTLDNPWLIPNEGTTVYSLQWQGDFSTI